MSSRRKTNRPDRIRQNVAAGEALGSLARSLGGTPLGLGLAWAQVADARLRQRARPLRLEGKTLVLRVEAESWAAEIRRHEEAILERLAGVLGEGKVRSLELRVIPGPVDGP
ncbi:MAG: DciA family protein [Deltaproteobacteria bacterium]|nr:DciA family protein [Deltaproteobacteria bacterium]